MVVITFAYQWYIIEMLKRYKLENYFDLIISADDVKNPKPDPEAVLTAANKLGISLENIIVVGDAKNDILMGKAACCKTVLFHPLEYKFFYNLNELKKEQPKYIIENIYDLVKLI